uniref:Homeobox protein invected n=1 Tax=Glossina austeni TaxID=7395 RepID=A0A1A9UQ26_GLOAU
MNENTLLTTLIEKLLNDKPAGQIMHPDYSLVLQKCASSPRLCVQQTLTIAADYLIPPPPAMAATATFAECCKNAQPTKGDEFVRIDSDEDEDCDNLTTTTTTTASTTNRRHPLFIGENEDDDEIVDEELDETKSMCSELSVGREVQTVDDLEGATSKPPKDPGGRVSLLDMNDNHSNSSQDDDTNADAVRTSKSTQRNPFALASSLRFSVPFGFPTNPACPAISPFQEEFLRKSHLYAEELMKHQMQLMAAARASAFSLRSTQNTALAQSPLSVNSFSKIGQISAAAAAAAMASNLTVPPQQYNFQPQHYATVPSDTLAKLSALSKQAPSTQVMSTLNQLQTQMQARLPSALLNNDHEQLHERALKFSIDNILKADFGRNHYNDLSECSRKSNNVSKIARSSKRNLTTNNHATNSNDITDALPSPTQTYSTSVSVASMCTNSNDSSSTAVSSSYGGGSSVDLVKLSPLQTPAVSPQSQAQPTIASAQPATALLTSTSCNNSTESAKVTGNCASKSSLDDNKETCSSTSSTSGGSGPIVWPAWVYCTRYSDRPSSVHNRIDLKLLPQDDLGMGLYRTTYYRLAQVAAPSKILIN